MSQVAPLDDGPRFKGLPVLRLTPRAWADRSARIRQRRPVCEAHLECCTGRTALVHHVLRRSQGGSDHIDNLLALCGPCHEWIHANTEDAYDLGLLRRKGS